MHRTLMTAMTAVAVALSSATAFAQAPPAKNPPAARKQPLVEFELMTWPEVKQALADGRTTALVYTGGTEQRGPQNVNGGHTLMGREIVRTIALRLGNAIAMPVLPYTPNNVRHQDRLRREADPGLPRVTDEDRGTIADS